MDNIVINSLASPQNSVPGARRGQTHQTPQAILIFFEIPRNDPACGPRTVMSQGIRTGIKMLDVVVEYDVAVGPRRKFWLRSGESILVGATDQAECRIDFDDTISPIHFKITNEGHRIVVRDLNSQTGTFHNNERIAEFSIRHNDVIRAGRTNFHTRISIRRQSTPAPVQPEVSHAILHERSSQPNGLTRIGSKDPADRRGLVECLQTHFQLGAILNTSSTAGTATWIDRAIHINGDLVMLPIQSEEDIVVVSENWGKDHVVIVSSEEDHLSLAERVRRNASAFLRSRIVRAQLIHGPEGYVQMLLQNIKAVVVEPASGEGWCLFGKLDVCDMVSELCGKQEAENHSPIRRSRPSRTRQDDLLTC